MSFRLRHRASFSPSPLASSLHLHTARTHTPSAWHWTYPQHHPLPPPPTPPTWVSSIRAAAISDDATYLAFISHDAGRVALISLHPTPQTTSIPPPLHDPSPATSAAFLSLPRPLHPPQPLLAIGYHSGTVAVYTLATSPPSPISVSRPAALPVRRLRFYPAFHLLSSPAHSNAGLFAVLGWSGTLARLPASELAPLLADPPPLPAADICGRGWFVWQAPAQDAVLDAVACADQPGAICELDPPAQRAALRVVTAGARPPLCAYALLSDPAFSARDAAKRAASTVLSAAKGFLLSRVVAQPPPPHDEGRKAVNGVISFSTSWADGVGSAPALISLGDVTDTARKSVSAVLTRGRRGVDMDGAAVAEGLNKGWDALRGEVDARLAVGGEGGIENLAESLLSRQRSRFSGEEVANAANLPRNARVVERICAAPLPCTLLATADTLGRIFVQDSRDLCVLRVMKGYRDGHVAWLAQGGPLLVVFAPRLNVLEVHEPLESGRVVAFEVPKGSLLMQSCSHRVFCVSPEGGVWEVMRARKGQDGDLRGRTRNGLVGCEAKEDVAVSRLVKSGSKEQRAEMDECVPGTAPDYETVGIFIEAVKKSQTSTAVECLQKFEGNVLKVAHLMATLVTCTAYARTDVHVALASKAAQIAYSAKNTDLVSRFEAHSRLAEAFALLFAENTHVDEAVKKRQSEKYGPLLLQDELGQGLDAFVLDEQSQTSTGKKSDGKRRRSAGSEDDAINCERFILSHMLEPNSDFRGRVDYVLRPRRDLSEAEQVWLAKLYFARLFEVDSTDMPSEGREHPATKDIFVALTDLISLPESAIAKQFVVFFLNTPLLPLLKTHAALYASPLRCAIARLRSRYTREVVDRVLLDECERSTQIPNAVLMARLCAVYETGASAEPRDAPFSDSLNRLSEVLVYRKLIAHSAVSEEVWEKFTARRCTGIPGDAERHALTCLIEANDFGKASDILRSLDTTRRRQNLEWHESTSVSEAALHACRRKASGLLTEGSCKVIPSSVVTWIRAAEKDGEDVEWHELIAEKRELILRQLRAVLLSAHQYFPDSSVDAVRCLQLAEAMSAMIELEVSGGAVAEDMTVEKALGEPLATGKQHDEDQKDITDISDAVDVDDTPEAKDQSTDAVEVRSGTPGHERSASVGKVLEIPTMSQESFDSNPAPVVGEDCWDIDMDDLDAEEPVVDGDSSGNDDELPDAVADAPSTASEGIHDDDQTNTGAA